MKMSIRFPKLITLFFIIFLLFAAGTEARTDRFGISTNSLYYPGDKISLFINSYDYDNDNTKNQEWDFVISVLKIKDINSFYTRQTSRYNVDVLSKDSMNLLYLTEEIDSYKRTLKSKKEYSYYSYLNETIDLGARPKGAYLVKVTSGKNVAYCGFVVSDLGIVSKAGYNSMLAYVVDRRSGNPVMNADLSFFLGTKQIGQGRTAADGIFYQTVSAEDRNSGKEAIPMIIGKSNDDVILSDYYLFFGYAANKFTTYIFTEQPVYRTGSEVNFKGTIRSNDNGEMIPFAGKQITVTIKDPKGAEVYKEVTSTNSMGSFDGKYKIEEEGSLGTYVIYAAIDENSTYTGTFEVEQYKKPEYKVTVTTDKSQYYGKDNLTANVEAKYFFGSPVTDAEVEYNIYKVRYYKPWWMFSEYAWWYSDYYENQDDNYKYAGSQMVYSGTGKLDSEGKMIINYQIDEDFKDTDNDYHYYDWYRRNYETDYRYIVQANVVDKSRREISGTTSAFVTRGGFSLSANADKYLYKPGETANIEVFASDFSNKAVETNFEATLYKTSWERDYNKEKKDYIRSLQGSTRSDGKGIVSFDLPASDANGNYYVEIKAKDDRGNDINTSAYFYVSDGDYSWWWYGGDGGGIQIIPDKASYRIGEICKAIIFVTNPDINALITTNTDDIIYYSSEKFTGTVKQIEFPITDKYSSGFNIEVNYIYQGAYYTQSKRMLVVPEEKFLTVTIDPSKLIYKPKETGQIKVRVLDNKGNPVNNAEVALGIVDESIYSIREDRTPDIRKYFYGEKYNYVSTAYNNNYTSSGQSRLITIYERFNLKSTSVSQLATVKGRVLDLSGVAVQGMEILIDNEYLAGVTDEDGNFEFRLPEGEYDVKIYNGSDFGASSVNLNLTRGSVKEINFKYDRSRDEMIDAEENRGGNERQKVALKKDYDAPRGIVTDEIRVTESKSEISMDKGASIIEKEFVTPDLRSDFRDAIYWSPYVMTDADGYAYVDVTYPDNLTSWRITSRVITEDTKVGQMTNTVITRKDLLVRMETPRFLQENDEVTISTIIHNYLDSRKNARVKFKGENVTLLDGSDVREISIDANSDVRIDWKIKITQPVGEAKLYAEALTNEVSDAMEVKIPLQPKGLKVVERTVADFSDEFKTEVKTVNIPLSTDLRSAGLNINVDPSLASTILSALDELVGYPYGCVEQTMSRFLPTVVVANTFIKLNAPISEATKKDLPLMVNKGLQRLYSFQHSDGGWGWWENDGSNPFMTAYVVYGLSIAKQSNYEVTAGVLKKGITAMKSQLKGNTLDATTRAYILYSLAVAEERDQEFFKQEIDKIIASEMNDYTRALIAMTWKIVGNEARAKDALADLEKNVKMTGEGAAYWEGKQFHYNWQEDKVQTTAMALKAIVNINDNSALKDKVIRWLMTQRQGRGWMNTQETAMIIYAMVDYLQTSNELSPSYNVKVFVNGKNVFEKQMTSEDVFKKTDRIKLTGDMLQAGNNEIRIVKSGSGKVYFSGITYYYNSSDNIAADESGFRVEKEYFKLEKYDSYTDDRITYKKRYTDGNLKSGDEILVKIKVYSNTDNFQYFMLEDPLPAGVEVIKDDWAYKIEDEKDYGGYSYYYWRWWYADKEVRDNRVTYFVTYLGKGEYEFSYIMRAQIPGEYTVNPSVGQLMYYPEVSGNTGLSKLVITD